MNIITTLAGIVLAFPTFLADITPVSPENLSVPTPVVSPPGNPDILGPCPGTLVSLVPGADGLQVKIHPPGHEGPKSAVLTNTGPAGYYKIYFYNAADSECHQKNESAYLNVTNPTNVSGKPKYVNCNSEWVSIDPDNKYWGCSLDGNNISDSGVNGWTQIIPPDWKVHDKEVYYYYGTFWLEPGANNVAASHACPLMLNHCPEHVHLGGDPDNYASRVAKCTGNHTNSVHLEFNGQVCIIPE